MTCNQKGTITDVLNSTNAFKKLRARNDKKELVILKEGRAISTHFPCCLIGDETLKINYVKKEDEEMDKRNSPSIETQSGNVIVFHLCASGAENTRRILKNLKIKPIADEITVYAYEGETVENALRRDGRLREAVFEGNCGLTRVDADQICEFSNIVYNMNDKHFKICMGQKMIQESLPRGQAGSIGEADMPNEGDQDLSQLPPTTETGNESPQKKKREQNECMSLLDVVCEIPKSEGIMGELSQEFIEAMKAMNISVNKSNSFSLMQKHLHVEFTKNEKACREVKVMKKMMELSNVVCFVNSTAKGTGFLLFDRFVLTNYHVIKGDLSKNGTLQRKVTVNFLFEEINSSSLKDEVVKEVVAFRCLADESVRSYDWALLELDENPDINRPCLLKHFGYLPPSGGLCIIGHPDLRVKMIDPCYIIPATECGRVVKKHRAEGCTQWVGRNFFQEVEREITKRKNIVRYKTCFYFGASGSPVFDNNCKVVAMHSGGYRHPKATKKSQGIIEFGYLLSNILEDMIIKLVEEKRLDVLGKFFSVKCGQKQNIMDGVKKVVEGRHYPGFQDALQSDEVTNNEELKGFLDFICQEQERPMEV